MKRGPAILVTALLILTVLLSVWGVYYVFFMPNNNVIAAFDETVLNMVIEGERIADARYQPKIVDSEIILPIDAVKKFFDPNIWWDAKLNKVTITTGDKVIRMKTDNLEALVNGKPLELKIPVSVENDIVYIPIAFLSDYYNIEINYLKENNVIIIDYKNSIRQLAEPVSEKAVVRSGRSVRNPIIRKLDLTSSNKDENTLRIFEEYERWYKVRTSMGEVGYIEKKHVVVKRMLVKKIPEEKPNNTWKPEKGKINLVWEQIHTKTPEPSKIAEMEGLDVVSPTWFTLIDDKGVMNNTAESGYVEWAHKNGYKVWALFRNSFGDIDMTSRFLNNTDARENAIRQLLAFSSLYKLDGINIDLENIYIKDKDALTQFVREAAPLFREQGLVVSIDVNVPDGSPTYSLCYDTEALGKIVDYVMLMAYNQHWPGGPQAGSVAQITWVEKYLVKVLDMVPKDKLILGIPFYTYLWEEKIVNGVKSKPGSKSQSMEAVRKLVEENKAAAVWDEESGQFYAEYVKDGSTYKVWIEDANSINLKSSLVLKYDLAGTAAWSRNFVSQDIWGVLNKNLKTLESFAAWKEQNKDEKYAYNR